ncbi:MAG: hemolysin III family protein [Bacteroidales bacterium]|nr:hemolysin III family protein [Bacteroidales bacterium]MDY4558287.1 hemolysin III family protein [Alloprevotella sp.]
MNAMKRRSGEERFNTLTHLAGVVFTLAAAWFILKLGYGSNWKNAFGTTFFTCGMLLMYAASTLYHWAMPGKAKRRLRIFDHISIYVMIAASYTPICIGVVGGALGWTVFGILWGVALGGAVYKLTAMDRYPRLSLFLYLLMGWSFIFMAEPVCSRLPSRALCAILAEGLFYTSGTWFFAHDSKPYFHGVWHIFVLLGSVAHWLAILFILSE